MSAWGLSWGGSWGASWGSIFSGGGAPSVGRRRIFRVRGKKHEATDEEIPTLLENLAAQPDGEPAQDESGRDETLPSEVRSFGRSAPRMWREFVQRGDDELARLLESIALAEIMRREEEDAEALLLMVMG